MNRTSFHSPPAEAGGPTPGTIPGMVSGSCVASEAIIPHLASLRQHGEAVPQPTTKTITIAAA
ncbi:MAG: hypothetical protein WC058_10435 [Phycisphaeraceae bacterium]